jgi:hypothetical protein
MIDGILFFGTSDDACARLGGILKNRSLFKKLYKLKKESS